jgi:hypothetical protein
MIPDPALDPGPDPSLKAFKRGLKIAERALKKVTEWFVFNYGS